MTLEPDLAQRLRAEADRLEVSDPLARRIARRGRRRSRFRLAGMTLALLAFAGTSAGLGLLVTQDDPRHLMAGRGVEETSLQASEERQEAYENFEPIFGRPAPRPGGGRTSGVAGTGGSASGVATSGTVDSAQQGSSAGQGSTTPSVLVEDTTAIGSLASPRVIKTARIRIEVEEDSLSSALAEAERLASRHGGFVSESATTTTPARSGELTIRVPAPVFESVVADLKSLGRVESQRVSGVDVTAEFVDLQARLRNWEAHERVLMRLMSEANSIAESLQVQRELQNVRLEIERILGQLRVLRDQTDLATISIAIHEPGAAEPEEEEGAWERAWGAATRVLEAMLVGLGYLVPILAALLVLWLIVRAIRSRRTA